MAAVRMCFAILAGALHAACATRAHNHGGRAPIASTCTAPRGSVRLAVKKSAKPSAAGRGFGAAPAPRGAAAPAAPELLGGYEALYDWIDAAGGSRRVAIANFGGLRGVMATAPIAKGEVAISIPSSLAVDLGVDGSDPLPAARAFLRVWRAYTTALARSAAGEALSADEAAALRLRPFLDAIPPQGSSDLSTPDFFAPDELAALQWPPLEAEVAARAAALRAAAADACASGELAQVDAATLASLNWARWVVLSRVLTVQDALPTGYGTPRAARKLLIPLIDMCNHHASRWNGIPSGRVGGNLSILAAKDIQPGEQVMIQYGGGVLSNAQLLAEYGFVDGSASALELDMQMLARALRESRAPGAVHAGAAPPPLPTSALGATTLAQDERLLADTVACPPGSRMATAVRFRAILKRAFAELLSRQMPGGAA